MRNPSMPRKRFRDHLFAILGWTVWLILQLSGRKFGHGDSPAMLAAGSALTFVSGSANVLQGRVHLMPFVAYPFFAFVP